MNDSIANWGNLTTPYSQESEEATLGAVMVNGAEYYRVAAFLTPDDFFILRHRYIWDAMAKVAEKENPIDYMTIQTALKDDGRLSEIGGPAYLTQLINTAPTSAYPEVYGREVLSYATRRRLMAASDAIKALALDTSLTLDDVCTNAISTLDAVMPSYKEQILPGSQSIEYYQDLQYDITQRIEAGEMVTYPMPAEWESLAELVPSLTPGELVIISSASGNGKSACLEQLGEHTAGQGIPTKYVHTEMSTEDVLHRRMARHSGLSFDLLRSAGYANGQKGFTSEQAAKVVKAEEKIEKFARKLSYAWMPDVAFEKLQQQMRRDAMAGVKVFLIDHFQDIQVNGGRDDNPVRAYEKACIWLAAFAEKRRVVVVVASQENAQGKTKWSTKLLEKAVTLISIKRAELENEHSYIVEGIEYKSFPGQKNPVTSFEVLKARFGRTGKVNLVNHGPRFQWLDQRHVQRKAAEYRAPRVNGVAMGAGERLQ